MASSMVKLSSNSIQLMLKNITDENPVVQVLNIKRLNKGDRYRLIVSDGDLMYSFAMLGTQLNHQIESGKLDKYAVIRVTNFLCNETTVSGSPKKILIIMEYDLLKGGNEVGEKIGNPINYEANGSDNVPAPVSYASSINENKPIVNDPNHNKPFQDRRPVFQESRRDSLPGQAKLVQPISCITPYQNRWTIKARVTSKSAIRTFTNNRGEGKFFSIEALDDSCDVKVTAFGDACDKFFDKIEVNKVYYISRGTVKPVNKMYNRTKNDYEITFNNETTVEPCYEDTSDVPMLTFSFVQINQLNSKSPNDFVDVIGICKSFSEVQTIVARTSNRELKKRNINLVDQSNSEVAVTLWNNEAESFDGANNPVIAIKGAKVSDFGGVSLNVSATSTLLIDPDISESHKLKAWYQMDGYKMDTTTLTRSGGSGGGFSSNWKHLEDIITEKLGMGDKGDYITVKAYITLIKTENAMYKACAEDQCKKKVVENSDGSYLCEKCNKESDKFKWVPLLQVSISDFTDSVFMTCFQECAEKVLGKSTSEISAIYEQENTITGMSNLVLGKQFIFKLKVSSDHFNDEQRVRISAVEASPVNFVEYHQKLVTEIRRMKA